MSDSDPYRVLGVAKDASDAEIKRAYRKLARQYHPDRNDDAAAEERFKRIQSAHEQIGTPEDRAKFDQEQQMRNMFGGGGGNPFSGMGGGEGNVRFDFGGGGTVFEHDGVVARPVLGGAVAHGGQVRHGGVAITWGERLLLVGFVAAEPSAKSYSSKLARWAAYHAYVKFGDAA